MISRAITANISVGDSVLLRPLFLCRVQAGYPSPADDEVEDRLDLNRHIFKKPESTMMVWMQGDGFKDEGVFDGDLLVADSSVKPREGNLVVVLAGQEQLIKKVARRGGQLFLVDGSGPSEMTDISDPGIKILAVVTFTIHTIPE
jgi:DNA polymerase V